MTPHALEITPRGSGGVSIVAVRGPGALELVAPLCSATPSAGDFRLVRITDGEEELDEALLLCDSPESVELHVHGSPAVVRRLLSALRERGALDPPEGLPFELEERAEQRLAFSAGEAGARILLDQAEGALRRELEALSMERAGFQARARRLLARSRFALRAIEPTSVCLLGRPNAGKSTLFNALLGARRVVESAEAGTTRDTIRERVRLGAYPVDLVDTAGLSPGRTPGRTRGRTPGRGPEVAPPLDAESQRLARRALEASELGLWLQPVGEPTHQAEEPAGGPPLLRVATFADRVEPRPPGAISALRDPTGARSAVTELFRSAFELPTDPWTPGGAALFERELLDALEHATRAGAPERERILAGLLAPASGVGAGAGVGRAAIGAPDVVGRAPRG